MTGTAVREVRERLGWTQQHAARRWRVSQPYLSLLEAGRRAVPVRLAKVLAREDSRLATGLPTDAPSAKNADPAGLLGSLGYPGFEYLREPGALTNPAAVVLAVLSADHTEPRVTEALPWLFVRFAHMDWTWLVDKAKLTNKQNRLGYLVRLARQLAERQGNTAAAEALAAPERALDEARLVNEDTMGRRLTQAERRHWRKHRPAAAAHWNVLTSLNVENLRVTVD